MCCLTARNKHRSRDALARSCCLLVGLTSVVRAVMETTDVTSNRKRCIFHICYNTLVVESPTLFLQGTIIQFTWHRYNPVCNKLQQFVIPSSGESPLGKPSQQIQPVSRTASVTQDPSSAVVGNDATSLLRTWSCSSIGQQNSPPYSVRVSLTTGRRHELCYWRTMMNGDREQRLFVSCGERSA